MNTLYARINTDWNQNFTSYSALAIILSTCVGSVAVMTALMQGNSIGNMFLTFLVVAGCSAHNASILTVQKPKFVLNLLITSLAISVFVIAVSLLF
ncbi:hypothetical protein [Spongiimicrobium salis]|uniref:hypothetical protein n=1 Tax=Spongiimicrobium salis TaxID=1667022 RepID=UPI00374D0A5A